MVLYRELSEGSLQELINLEMKHRVQEGLLSLAHTSSCIMRRYMIYSIQMLTRGNFSRKE
jgi:hypothetical protein